MSRAHANRKTVLHLFSLVKEDKERKGKMFKLSQLTISFFYENPQKAVHKKLGPDTKHTSFGQVECSEGQITNKK